MRTLALLVLLLAVAACAEGPTPLQEAEERYDYLASHSALPGELCAAAGEVKRAAIDVAIKAETGEAKRAADVAHAQWSLVETAHCRG